MKAIGSFCVGVISFVFCIAILIACTNRFSAEEFVDNGDIPLKFVAEIHENTNTRMSNNQFEEGDGVGLFALAEHTTMQEERYVDNLRFMYSSDGNFVSQQNVYYPDDDVTLHLISYYPYSEEGVEMGKSSMPIAVSANQNDPEEYSHSDFLLASKENVKPSKEPITLTYHHQLFRLKLVLVPGEGESLEQLLAANPSVSTRGFYTKAYYDFQKQVLLNYSDEMAITPAGEWKEENGRLVGKEFILIPQETTVGYHYMTLEVNGKSYMSWLPSTLQLQGGKQRELEITFVAAEDILMSKINGEITDWEGTEVDNTTSSILHKSINVSQLSFEKSNVYKVLNNKGEQVAEICKEYLVDAEEAFQAIVVYPMKEDAAVDLSRGVAVQLLGQSGMVHGGSVSWNVENPSLTYVPGHSSLRNDVYILSDGSFSLNLTSSDQPQPVLVMEDVVRDVRGSLIHNYPLVKIGTQYWLRSNLEVPLLTNGDEIAELDVIVPGTIGYLRHSDNYFYTANAALEDNLLPAHWRLPKWEDWNILGSYLKNDISVLKSGTWTAISEREVRPATNLTGFDASPVGMWVEPNKNVFKDKYLGYWTVDESGTSIAEKVFYLTSETDTIGMAAAGIEKKAFAIRCIRE